MASKASERIAIFIVALLFFITSVGTTMLVLWQMQQDDNAENQQTAQPEEKRFLENFTPVSSVDKLEKIDIKAGSGETVKEGATITAHYTGALAKDGSIFESSRDSGQPANLSLNGVIKGWTQGVPGMKVGGVRRLVIPAELAYGSGGNPPKIGPNEPLVFDIELISIGK